MPQNLYKKKGLGDVDPKSKRLLRRSLHQKDVREQAFLTRRGVDDELSPLKEPKEVIESNAESAVKNKDKRLNHATTDPPVTKLVPVKKVDARREMLNKWKEEKEMKRKIDNIKNESSRPSFKVRKVEHKDSSFLAPVGANKKKVTKKDTTVPIVRRSSRLATKETPSSATTRGSQSKPASIKPSTTTTRSFTTGVKSTKVPAPLVKKPTKRPAPKGKETNFPTAKSFTFKKEVAAPPKTTRVPLKKDNTAFEKPSKIASMTRAPTEGRLTRQTEARVTRQAAPKNKEPIAPKKPMTRNQNKQPAPGPKKISKMDTSKTAAARSDRIPTRAASTTRTQPTQRPTTRGDSTTRSSTRASSREKPSTRANSSTQAESGLKRRKKSPTANRTEKEPQGEMASENVSSGEDADKQAGEVNMDVVDELLAVGSAEMEQPHEQPEIPEPNNEKEMLLTDKATPDHSSEGKSDEGHSDTAEKVELPGRNNEDTSQLQVYPKSDVDQPGLMLENTSAGDADETPEERAVELKAGIEQEAEKMTENETPEVDDSGQDIPQVTSETISQISPSKGATETDEPSAPEAGSDLLDVEMTASRKPVAACVISQVPKESMEALPEIPEKKPEEEIPEKKPEEDGMTDENASQNIPAVSKDDPSVEDNKTCEQLTAVAKKELGDGLITEDGDLQAQDSSQDLPKVPMELPQEDTSGTDAEEASQHFIGAVDIGSGDVEMTEEETPTVEETNQNENQTEKDRLGEPLSDSEITPKDEEPIPAPTKAEGIPGNESVVREDSGTPELVVSEEDRAGAERYQGIMDKESERMTGLCTSWEERMVKETIPEDVRGDIRSAIGKAQLLMNQRFNQFGGLIEQCRLGLGEKRTHTTDLQGFWDMVYYQIEDVDKMFAKLSELEGNNWIHVEDVPAKPEKKKLKKKKLAKKPLGNRKAARERLAAFKAAMKEQQPTETVIFDAGAFRIESPVKSRATHCEAGLGSAKTTPTQRRSKTPQGSSKRSSLDHREQHLLRAVLQASHTPNAMRSRLLGLGSTPAKLLSPQMTNAKSIFTPGKGESSLAQSPLSGPSIFTPEKVASPAKMTPQSTKSSMIGQEKVQHSAVLAQSNKGIFTPERTDPSTQKPAAVQSPIPGGGIFSPERPGGVSMEEGDMEGEIVSEMQDLGLGSSRKRRCSQRNKSQESDDGGDAATTSTTSGKQNDLAMYLMPTLPTEDDNDLDGEAGEMGSPTTGLLAEQQPELVPVSEYNSSGDDKDLNQEAGETGSQTGLMAEEQQESVPVSEYNSSAVFSDTGVISPLRLSPSACKKTEASSSLDESCSPSKVAKMGLDAEVLPWNNSIVSMDDEAGADHFQGVMNGERQRLTSSCSSWTHVLDNEPVSEEVSGEIRSAIGKAQLLMNQRFNQFGGLIEQCRQGLGEKRTHTTDLQGFWDMVHYQIEDVDGMFEKLSERKENGWVAKEEETKPVVKKVTKKKITSKSKGSDADRKAARERLAAAKAVLMKKQTRQNENTVFDAGFFKVESLAKSRGPHHMTTGSPTSSPLGKRSRVASPLLMRALTPLKSSLTPHKTPHMTPERTPLADRQRDMLRAVLQASSKTPLMTSPSLTGSIFSPERTSPTQTATPSVENDMVAKLQDLGLNSGKSSTRKRRRSTRNKKDATENVEKENECDLSKYLMPSRSEGHHNAGPTNLLKNAPLEGSRDLGTRTPLGDRKDKQNGVDVYSQPPSKPGLSDDFFGSPALTPRRSSRLKHGRVSGFSPPRRSFAVVPPSTDLMSFD